MISSYFGDQAIIDHTAIAVQSIDDFLKSFRLLGTTQNVYRETLKSEGLHVAFLPEPFNLELIEPIQSDSSVGRFIQKNGSGKIHHIAYKVKDISLVLKNLQDASIELIDKTPRNGSRNKKIAFIHPKSTGGILIELCGE